MTQFGIGVLVCKGKLDFSWVWAPLHYRKQNESVDVVAVFRQDHVIMSLLPKR
jgi:hypothetical protein